MPDQPTDQAEYIRQLHKRIEELSKNQKKPRGVNNNPNGVVLWEDETIAFIATGIKKGSANDKTGAMVQGWILRKDMHPADAVKTGADDAICGNCPLRGKNGKERGCYVNYVFGPAAIYKTLAAKKYTGKESGIRGKVFRFGAYGDPYFVPVEVLERVAGQTKKHTGYTHQWRESDAGPYAKYLMASVENLADKAEANAQGWRAFRVTSDLDTKTADEVICPASEEMGKKTDCATCGLCNGNFNGKKKNVVIMAHGSKVAAGKVAKRIAE